MALQTLNRMPIAPERAEMLLTSQEDFSHTKISVRGMGLSPLENSNFSQEKIKPAGTSNGNADLISRIIERK